MMMMMLVAIGKCSYKAKEKNMKYDSLKTNRRIKNVSQINIYN